MSVSEKRICIQPEFSGLSIVRQCELLSLPRSSFYRGSCEPSRVSPEDQMLMRLIDEEYTRHPFYGSRKIKVWLKRQGYKVNAASNSLEVLERFKADPGAFDLVISDMAMPHMTGDLLAQELIKIRPDIPIILCTGHSDRMDGNRAKAIGVKAFVFKPLVMKDMAKTVRKVLDGARG